MVASQGETVAPTIFIGSNRLKLYILEPGSRLDNRFHDFFFQSESRFQVPLLTSLEV